MTAERERLAEVVMAASPGTPTLTALKIAEAIADLLAARDRRVRAEAVETIARQSERLRRENPMNGDGANHMLDRVQRIMAADSPGAPLAIEAERKVIWAEREADYARLEAENKRRLEADA